MYIVFEGLDGSGKSTQVELLQNALFEHLGTERVWACREPGGTPAAEKIRDLLKDPANDFPPETELLLMTAARSALKVGIEKELENGWIVISDRNYLSTFAYQGAGHDLMLMALRLHSPLIMNLAVCRKPDLTFILTLPKEVAKARRKLRSPEDRIEQRDDEYFDRVFQYYNTFVGSETDSNIITIDATLPIESIHSAVLSIVLKHLKTK